MKISRLESEIAKYRKKIQKNVDTVGQNSRSDLSVCNFTIISEHFFMVIKAIKVKEIFFQYFFHKYGFSIIIKVPHSSFSLTVFV